MTLAGWGLLVVAVAVVAAVVLIIRLIVRHTGVRLADCGGTCPGSRVCRAKRFRERRVRAVR